jgi:hypothetical protein
MAPAAVLLRDQPPSMLVGLLGLNQRSMRWPKCSTEFLQQTQHHAHECKLKIPY